jgi:hypothetical protein
MPNLFNWMDDPNSTVVVDPAIVSREITGDTITNRNFQAVDLTDKVLPDTGLMVPYIWVRVSNTGPEGNNPNDPSVNHFEPLTWNNALGGWFTSDFHGLTDTHESLLVTLQTLTHPGSPNGTGGQVAIGTVADLTGTHPYPTDSLDVPAPFPEEKLQPQDRVPYANLGALHPGEPEFFDLAFTYHWSGADLGAYRTALQFNTIAHDHVDTAHSPGDVHNDFWWA